MLLGLILVFAIAGAMVLLALYVVVRAHTFKTKPSDEFEDICKDALDKHLFKEANKSKIRVLLAENGAESADYIQAKLGVSRVVLSVYLNELTEEGRVVQLINAGQTPVYRLGG